MADFSFITTSVDPKLALKDDSARQLIRKVATRATRSSKAAKTSQQHHHQSDATRKISQRGGMTRFRTQKDRSSPVKVEATIRPTLAMSPLMNTIAFWDPVVGPLGGQAWTLLHYYRFSFRSRSWAVDGKQVWFSFVITNPGPTHATLAFVSLNRDLEEGSSISQSTLHHRAKAMSFVRKRLDASDAFLDDSLMAAIALLAIAAGLEGHFTLAAAHFAALAKLVGFRGGYQQLQDNEALYKLVAWADLCNSASLQKRSHLPGEVDRKKLDVAPESFSEMSAESLTFQHPIEEMLSTETNQVIRLLAAIPRRPPTEETTLYKRRTIGTLISSMNQTILSFLRRSENAESLDVPARLEKLVHVAAYTYIALVLRQMPRRTQVVVERSQNLHDALESTKNDVTWSRLPRNALLLIRLWACTVYYCSQLPPDRDSTLLAELQSLIGKSRITSISALEDRLGHISWVHGYAQEDLKLLFHRSP